MSKRSPLLIVLDDLHWADMSSWTLLGYLVRHLEGLPIVVLGTYCRQAIPIPHPFGTLIASLQYERAAKALRLEPLTANHIETLVSHVVSPRCLSADMMEHIQVNAAGNPFFAETFACSPLSRWLEAIVLAFETCLGNLSIVCQQLLGMAAMLGGTFESSFLVSMMAQSLSVDEATILAALEEALCWDILREERSGRHILYRFRYPLLAQHLCMKMPKK